MGLRSVSDQSFNNASPKNYPIDSYQRRLNGEEQPQLQEIVSKQRQTFT